MLEVQNLNKSFGQMRVENENFTINDGEILGLIGQTGPENHYIRMILGLLKPDSGSVLWNGQPLHAKIKISLVFYRKNAVYTSK